MVQEISQSAGIMGPSDPISGIIAQIGSNSGGFQVLLQGITGVFFYHLLFIMKVEYSDYGDDKIPSNSTDLIINQSPLFTCHTHRSIMKYRNIIKVVIATYWGFHWDKYIPSKYILIDEQFDYQTYINKCPRAYNILTAGSGNPVLFNELSMITLKDYRNLPASTKISGKYREALELWDRVIQFPEFLPKLDQIPGDFRVFYRIKDIF